MTLSKAIEILQMDIKDPGSVAIEDVNQAEGLSIEALERVLDVRRFPEASNWKPLPGETKQ